MLGADAKHGMILLRIDCRLINSTLGYVEAKSICVFRANNTKGSSKMRCGCKVNQRLWPSPIAAQLRRNKKAEEEKRHSGAQYVEHVLQDSGLSMPLVLLTDGYGGESFKQVEEIVSFVRRSDRVRVRYASSRRLGKLNISTACVSEATVLCAILPSPASCCLLSGLVWYSCYAIVALFVLLLSNGCRLLLTPPSAYYCRCPSCTPSSWRCTIVVPLPTPPSGLHLGTTYRLLPSIPSIQPLASYLQRV